MVNQNLIWTKANELHVCNDKAEGFWLDIKVHIFHDMSIVITICSSNICRKMDLYLLWLASYKNEIVQGELEKNYENKICMLYLYISEIKVVFLKERHEFLKIFFCRSIMPTVWPNCLIELTEIMLVHQKILIWSKRNQLIKPVLKIPNFFLLYLQDAIFHY